MGKGRALAMVKSDVPDRLAELADLKAERGMVYGDDYKWAGASLLAMFPRGLELRTAEEFGRFALFVHIHTKTMRYAQNMLRGGHADSLDDLAVYAMMEQELDDES